MKKWTWLAVMVLAAAPVWAADVQLKGLTYSDVKIVSADADSLSFRIFSGNILQKGYDEVVRITLGADDEGNFDAAEKLFAQGKFKEAIAEYDDLLTSKAELIRTLAKGRQGAAKAKLSASTQPAAPGATASGDVCLACRNTGLLPCPDCQNTGTAKCKTCAGAKIFGRIVCPKCNGHWTGDMCKYCGGKGTRSYTSYAGDGLSVIRRYVCYNCDGAGWFNTCECAKQDPGLRGTAQCPDCKGTGRTGVCPTCNGTKKIACKACKKGEELAKKPPPTPTPTPSPTPTPVAVTPTPTPAASGPAPRGEKLSLFGIRTRADNVVYLVDRSASMSNSFDMVRQEIVNSIGDLEKEQKFHLVFFANGKPMENKANKLVNATDANKTTAERFAVTVTPRGTTDHVAGVRRAMELLGGCEGGNCLFLVTDGPLKDGDKVLDAIKYLNKDKKVRIYTVLLGNKSEDAAKMFGDIASDSGGEFKKQ